jgi:hypothetical protein
MRAIWQFELAPRRGKQQVLMPAGAEIVHVGEQYRRICLWAIVNTIEPQRPRDFILVWTGESMPSMHKHLGLAQVEGVMWHVLEEDRS